MTKHKILWKGVAVRAALLLALFALFSAETWAQVGYVHALSGSATVQRGSAAPVPTKVGDTFDVGAVFATSGEGRVTLKFADGQVLVLAPRSEVRIQQFRFDPRNIKASNLAIGLRDGSLRFVGGAIAAQNREAVRISAGASTVSILRDGGIDFTVSVNTKVPEIGVAAVTLGEISVRTPYGPIVRIEADQAVPWRPGTTPPPPIPIAAAPAAIQAELTGLRLSVLPGNAPVAVDVAARAAVVSATPQPPVLLAANEGPAHAGYVHAVSGSVVAQGTSGRAGPVSVGDTFDPGVTFNTAGDGRVVLKFADGQTVVLGPASIVRVGQYVFDERNVKASSTSVELLNGSMRFVGGAIAEDNRDGIRVTAGASAIQILSTGALDFTVVVDTRAQEMGVAAVTAGEVSVRTPYGRITRIQPDQSAPWLPGRAPSAPVPLADAPTAVAGEISALLATATAGTGPVAVDSAARAVIALTTASTAEAAAAENPGNPQLQSAAQSAAEQAASALKSAAAKAEDLLAAILEVRLATLPATAVGTESVVTAAPVLAALFSDPMNRGAFPVGPITSTTTPSGGGGRCMGSPC